MVAVNNLYESRIRLISQQQLLKSGNINESNISLFENTEGLTQGMIDGSCTDGKDDGKLGLGESLKSLAKGAVKSLIPSTPAGWLKAIGTGILCAGLIAVTGGAATPFLIAGGAALGAVQTGKGLYQASQATTDAEKKAALENVGGGITTVAASAFAAKSYTNATGNALFGKGSLSTYKNAATQSVANVKTNFGNLTNSIKTHGSNFANSVKNDMNIRVERPTEMNANAIEAKNSIITEDGIEILSSDYASSSNIDKIATAREMVSNIGMDAKQLVRALSSDAKMGAKQIVSELVARGISREEAISLVAASNSKFNMEQEEIQSKLSQYYM